MDSTVNDRSTGSVKTNKLGLVVVRRTTERNANGIVSRAIEVGVSDAFALVFKLVR